MLFPDLGLTGWVAPGTVTPPGADSVLAGSRRRPTDVTGRPGDRGLPGTPPLEWPHRGLCVTSTGAGVAL